MSKPDQSKNHLVVFQEKAIRRTWHNEEWWFAIVDVVAVTHRFRSARGVCQGFAET